MSRSTGIPYSPFLDFNPIKGLNEVENPLRLSDKELVTANNIDLDNKGIWRRRKAWGTIEAGTFHSLCTDSKNLYYIDNGSLTMTTLSSSYDVAGTVELSTGWGDSPADSVLVNSQLFISNIEKIGYVDSGTFFDFSDAPLDKSELYPLPAGRLITYYNGRIFIAIGGTIWYSNELDYQHTEIKENFIMFPEQVTMMKATSKGLWISADKVYFLRGGDAKEFIAETKDSRKAIIGTATQLDSNDIDSRFDGITTIWVTHEGICMGTDNGDFTNLSVDKLNLNKETTTGASLIRYNQDGIQQCIMSMEGMIDPEPET